jgi:hypothetical protein
MLNSDAPEARNAGNFQRNYLGLARYRRAVRPLTNLLEPGARVLPGGG